MNNITTSVIICTRNRKQDLFNCLNSIAQQTTSAQELIIVDSSDIPLSQELDFTNYFVASTFQNTVLTYVHTTPGLTYQRNVGIAIATQEIIYFFDDDIVLDATYLQEMNSIFSTYAQYGGGMGSVTNIPPKIGGWQRVLRVGFSLQRDYASGTFTASGMPTHAYGMKQFMQVEVLGGCNMAFRKALLIKQQFDEKLQRYAYMEDCDISRRISLERPLFYNPKACLQHYNSPLDRDKVIDNRAMFIKNYSYLFFKNFYPTNRTRIVAYVWSITGLFVEAALIRNKNYIKGYIKGLREYYF